MEPAALHITPAMERPARKLHRKKKSQLRSHSVTKRLKESVPEDQQHRDVVRHASRDGEDRVEESTSDVDDLATVNFAEGALEKRPKAKSDDEHADG
jgi:hypothetical protein